MTITITQKELERAGKKRGMKYLSGYCDIVEDLGMALNVGGIQEEDWYLESIWQAEDYVKENFKFEDALFALTDKKFIALAATLGHKIPVKDDRIHRLSAIYALKDEAGWKDFIEEVKQMEPEDQQAIFPALQEEMDEARDSAEADMRKDFINGDYSGNFEGIKRLLCKEYEADSAEIPDHETLIMSWSDEEAIKDRMFDNYGRRDPRMFKGWLISDIVYSIESYKNKRAAENEKRAAERKEERERKEKRAAEDRAERIAKLKAIKK